MSSAQSGVSIKKEFPGKIRIGETLKANGSALGYSAVFKIKTAGVDFLGQLAIQTTPFAVSLEIFNENYFACFETDKDVLERAIIKNILHELQGRVNLPNPVSNALKTPAVPKNPVWAEETRPPQIHDNKETPELASIFDRLNREYFGGGITATIHWGKNKKGANSRSFRFGSYNSENRVIRISPRLRQSFVPFSVLELTVYHEMCHQFAPPVKRNGRRLAHHSEFKMKEKEYANYLEAKNWEKTNWSKLLAPMETGGGV